MHEAAPHACAHVQCRLLVCTAHVTRADVEAAAQDAAQSVGHLHTRDPLGGNKLLRLPVTHQLHDSALLRAELPQDLVPILAGLLVAGLLLLPAAWTGRWSRPGALIDCGLALTAAGGVAGLLLIVCSSWGETGEGRPHGCLSRAAKAAAARGRRQTSCAWSPLSVSVAFGRPGLL